MSTPESETDLDALFDATPAPEALEPPPPRDDAPPPHAEAPEEPGPRLTLVHDGVTYAVMSPTRLLTAGVPPEAVGAALKAATEREIARRAEAARAAMTASENAIPASAERSASWLQKEALARRILAGDETIPPEWLAAFDAEAAAGERVREALAALVVAKGEALQTASLMLDAAERTAVAAVRAVPDEAPDAEALVSAALETADFSIFAGGG